MKLIFLFALFLNVSAQAQFVKGRHYKGFIFNKDYELVFSIEDQVSRFTPDINEISCTEETIKNQLKVLNKSYVNQSGNCPRIDKKIKLYKRQYFGFINKTGEKIVWVNFIWDKNLDSQISKELIRVHDGCSYYWNIKVNITKKTAFDLAVNGKG